MNSVGSKIGFFSEGGVSVPTFLPQRVPNFNYIFGSDFSDSINAHHSLLAGGPGHYDSGVICMSSRAIIYAE